MPNIPPIILSHGIIRLGLDPNHGIICVGLDPNPSRCRFHTACPRGEVDLRRSSAPV
jgi:hypothetical protein